jgi:hypothetical protein
LINFALAFDYFIVFPPAAHCLRNATIFVTIGENRKTRFSAEEMKIYENYVPMQYPKPEENLYLDYTELKYTKAINDIGLVRLSNPVNYTDTIKPICLPTDASLKNFNYVNKTLTGAGWGEWCEFNVRSKKGRKSDFSFTVPTFKTFDYVGATNAVCEERYETLVDSQLCVRGDPRPMLW